MTAHIALVAVRAAVLVTGAFLTLSVFWRYLQSNLSKEYLLLSVGFGLIATGALVEGLLFEFFRMSLMDVHTVEAGFAVAGFLSVLIAIQISHRRVPMLGQ